MGSETENRVIAAARDLSDYLWQNAGETADFPVGIVAREPDGVESVPVVELLNELRDALKDHDDHN